MLCAGVVLLIAGYIIDRWLPINKNLWTSTFSIFMAGVALLSLVLFHWLIDIADLSRWAKPFIILGLNPITVYVLSQVFDTTLWILNQLMFLACVIDYELYFFKGFRTPIAKPETAALLHPLMIFCGFFVAPVAKHHYRVIGPAGYFPENPRCLYEITLLVNQVYPVARICFTHRSRLYLHD